MDRHVQSCRRKTKLRTRGVQRKAEKEEGSQYAYEKTLQWNIMTHTANIKPPKSAVAQGIRTVERGFQAQATCSYGLTRNFVATVTNFVTSYRNSFHTLHEFRFQRIT